MAEPPAVNDQILHGLLSGKSLIMQPTGGFSQESQVANAIQNISEAIGKVVQTVEQLEKNHTPQFKPPTDLSPADQKLFDCVQNKVVPAQGTVGQAFARAHPKGSEQRTAYDKLPNQAAKAQARLEWGERSFETALKKYSHVVRHTHSDTNVGEYVPFKILWDREGNDQSGYEVPLNRN